MGWRKVGGDGEELCRLIDYLVDGMQTLKSSIQMGRRLDGKGKMKVGSKELWCSGLYCDRAGNSTRPSVENTKIALRQMKDAKALLSSISKSLDDTIQTVTDDTSIDCRAVGLSSLPDDLLTYIFEIYVEMSVSPFERIDSDISPQILASVSRRFRQVALDSPGIWKHVSYRDWTKTLLLYKERCPNPIIHIDSTHDALPPVKMDKFHIYPYQQWRGLRIAYNDKYEGHLYFQHLHQIIRSPLDALEDLMICNDNMNKRDETPLFVQLDGDDLRSLSSWQMPNLTHLDLRNVLPLAPLQCSNVTSFRVHVDNYTEEHEDLNMVAFRSLLQSMPKMQSLHIALLDLADAFSNAPSGPVSLPELTSFKFEVGGTTSDLVVRRIMELVVTNELTRLALSFYPCHTKKEDIFDNWVSTIFIRRIPSSNVGYTPFVKVEEFSLDVERFRGSVGTFYSIFSAMPDVHTMSLILPENAMLPFGKIPMNLDNGDLHRLRSLHIKFLKASSYPDGFTDHLYNLDEFLRDGHCKELERVEIQHRRTDNVAEAKAQLQKTLGKKLHCYT
ncbi:hypothetical protein SCHPADRAFT_932053 [Schizopora paradoxa]|uniref:Uncharacterized protein n=1 Tax=Schizopora paradoxa TaxID=27342 RepID=A0A0H2REQ1_9AGAM|nr:hypothetical protein SCHPADRAFT_932053 [Schizopora paradoxa]